ncbi:hypothetical protein ACFL1R_04985 [Candidatus Latescibacterota bacterium]
MVTGTATDYSISSRRNAVNGYGINRNRKQNQVRKGFSSDGTLDPITPKRPVPKTRGSIIRTSTPNILAGRGSRQIYETGLMQRQGIETYQRTSLFTQQDKKFLSRSASLFRQTNPSPMRSSQLLPRTSSQSSNTGLFSFSPLTIPKLVHEGILQYQFINKSSGNKGDLLRQSADIYRRISPKSLYTIQLFA